MTLRQVQGPVAVNAINASSPPVNDQILAFSKTLQQVQVLDGGMLAKMLENGVKEDPWSSVARLDPRNPGNNRGGRFESSW
ncbi:uncharacterized protein LAJ45_09363 [Morchella importuna]|uniref:uncharacterized protein n=1 Tax=Morchella importuna TaxID=1174673 RepID=UPI001E8E9930|nr:uncharacterized protein LAJ45_09363 [Morchella importuna]KAH8146680.1 hypothetical protein LAJ45_09363 [Morchella importuna]